MMSTGIEEIDDLEPVSLNVCIVNQIIARKQIYPEMQVFVRGDRRADYGKSHKLMLQIKSQRYLIKWVSHD